jgi:hypothetical protein
MRRIAGPLYRRRPSADPVPGKEDAVSVTVIIKFPGATIERFREVYDRHRDTMMGIVDDGRARGALHHAFAEDENGELTVIDEWESLDQFESFFAGQEDIKKVMAEVGMSGPPVTTGYTIVDTPDRF